MRPPRGVVIIALSLLIGLGPILLAIAADALGGAFGCEVNEGARSACMVAGVDIGGALSGAFVLGWLTILLLPLAGLGVAAGLCVTVFDALRRRTCREGPAAPRVAGGGEPN